MSNPVLIKHRVNSSLALTLHNPAWGAEIDLRSDINNPQQIQISHDAWIGGENLETWLDIYVSKNIHGPIILNTKEDGLESRCIEIMKKKNIDNYFFLDTTIPTLTKTSADLKKHFSVRHSVYENLEFCLSLKSYASWVWVDCFGAKPVDVRSVSLLKNQGFKICIVSPELQGGSREDRQSFSAIFSYADAICTKFTD